jgi:hypothetical protein
MERALLAVDDALSLECVICAASSLSPFRYISYAASLLGHFKVRMIF